MRIRAGVAILLTSTCLSNAAFAQRADKTTNATSQSDTAISSSGASTLGSLPTDQRSTESIRVVGVNPKRTAIGGGLMVRESAPKSVSTVTNAFIEKQNPASNPFQLLRMLPGVNVSSTDPMGATGGSLTMRGLGSSQIAFQLEGVPVNDIGNAATYPQEIVDAENIAQIKVEQGAADLDTPSANASGGAVNVYLKDPDLKAGGFADVSYGSYSFVRGLVRLESGLIGNTNLRAYASYSKSSDVHWRGPGTDDKQHAELKAVNDWGQNNRVSLAFVINQLDNNQYPSVSADSWHRYGYGGNNPVGYTLPGNTVYNHNYVKNDSNFYRVRVNPFTNIYSSAPSNFTLTDHLSFAVDPYLWYGYGNGGGAYPQSLDKIQFGAQTYTGTLGNQTRGTVLAYNPSITQTYRPGVVSKFTLDTGINHAVLGYWFEYSWQRQTGPYSPVEGNGHPLNEWGDSNNLVLSNGQLLQYRNTLTLTQIHTVFVGDTLSLLRNKLDLSAGLKYSIIKRNGTNYLPNVGQRYVSTDNSAPLPTASVSYNINSRNQIFASVTTNFKTPTNYTLYDAGVYNPKTRQYATLASPNQRPEVSISEELGYRYKGDLINGSVTYFHYNFTNRQLSTSVIDPATGIIYGSNISAGGQTSDGVDMEIGTRPFHHFRPYASAEILHTTVDSNIVSGGDYLPTTGKLAPNAPQFQSAVGVDYDNGSLFGDLDLKYTGHQYADFMNQEAYNGYTTINAALGYRFHSAWHLKTPTLRLDLQNLTNEKYLGYANSVTTNAKTTRGVFGTRIAGKTPLYTIGDGFAAIATLSVGF